MINRTAPFPSDNLRLGSDLSRKTGLAGHVERERGLRSFLTWSFFLGQIAAAEAFLGVAGKGVSGEEEGNPIRVDEAEAVADADNSLLTPVAATADPELAEPASEAPSSAMKSAPPAGPDQSAMAMPSVEISSPASEPFTAAAGADGRPATPANPDHDTELAQPDMTSPAPDIGIDFGGLAGPEHEAPALIGDALGGVIDLAGGLGDLAASPGIDIGSTVDGALSGVSDFAQRTVTELVSPFIEDLLPDGEGLLSTVFTAAPVASAHLMQIANAAGGLLGAPLSAGLSMKGQYSDLTLSLAAAADVPTAPPMATASLLQSLPVIGDALANPEPIDAADQPASIEEAPAIPIQIAESSDLVKVQADLWS